MSAEERTLKELNELIEHCFSLREKVKDLKDQESEVNKKIKEKESIIQELLEGIGTNSFKNGMGTVSYSYRKSPKLIDKEKFFEYLKRKGGGIYEALTTVNSRTLSGFVKNEQQEYGDDLEIPGIDLENEFVQFSYRKNRS